MTKPVIISLAILMPASGLVTLLWPTQDLITTIIVFALALFISLAFSLFLAILYRPQKS